VWTTSETPRAGDLCTVCASLIETATELLLDGKTEDEAARMLYEDSEPCVTEARVAKALATAKRAPKSSASTSEPAQQPLPGSEVARTLTLPIPREPLATDARGTCSTCSVKLTPENSSKLPSGESKHIGCNAPCGVCGSPRGHVAYGKPYNPHDDAAPELSVGCPTCAAAIGEACAWPIAEAASYIHDARLGRLAAFDSSLIGEVRMRAAKDRLLIALDEAGRVPGNPPVPSRDALVRSLVVPGDFDAFTLRAALDEVLARGVAVELESEGRAGVPPTKYLRRAEGGAPIAMARVGVASAKHVVAVRRDEGETTVAIDGGSFAKTGLDLGGVEAVLPVALLADLEAHEGLCSEAEPCSKCRGRALSDTPGATCAPCSAVLGSESPCAIGHLGAFPYVDGPGVESPTMREADRPALEAALADPDVAEGASAILGAMGPKPRACEGCGSPSTHTTKAGVPLCESCRGCTGEPDPALDVDEVGRGVAAFRLLLRGERRQPTSGEPSIDDSTLDPAERIAVEAQEIAQAAEAIAGAARVLIDERVKRDREVADLRSKLAATGDVEALRVRLADAENARDAARSDLESALAEARRWSEASNVDRARAQALRGHLDRVFDVLTKASEPQASEGRSDDALAAEVERVAWDAIEVEKGLRAELKKARENEELLRISLDAAHRAEQQAKAERDQAPVDLAHWMRKEADARTERDSLAAEVERLRAQRPAESASSPAPEIVSPPRRNRFL